MVVLFLVVFSAVAAPVDAQRETASPPPTETEVATHVALAADGNATFEIEIRYRLGNTTQEAAFDQYRRRLEANRTAERAAFRRSVESVVTRSETRTGRSMTVGNVTLETDEVRVPQHWGIVRYRFEWHQFATGDGERIHVNGTLGGYFLAEQDTLSLEAPDGYTIVTVTPEPDFETATRAVWRGPRSFADEEPTLLVGAGDGAADGGDGGGTRDGTTLVPSRYLPLIAVAGVGLVALVFALRTRRAKSGGTAGNGGAPTDSGRPPEPTAPPTPQADNSAEAGATPPVGGPELSDDERVLELLELGDGKIRQQQVIEATGWSQTKVSRVIGRLAEQGRLEKLRIGRENLLSRTSTPDDSDESPPGE